MKTILLTNHYKGKPLELLENAVGNDFRLRMLSKLDHQELKEAVADADYLLVSGRMQIDQEILDAAYQLRMIQRTGVGLDNIDLAYLQSKGIPLYVNRGVNATSVAEYAVMLMLGTLKRNYAVNRQIREGIWKKQETGLTTHEICGKTIGIVGVGNIGKRVAKMLMGFDAHVIYTSRHRLQEEEEKALNISFCRFEKLIQCADIISLHCPYDEKTGYLITEKEIAEMKTGVILINTARGKLIEQRALSKALMSGKVFSVGMDVFEEEPLSGGEFLLSEEALLSPHIAGLSYEAFERMMNTAIENIRQFDLGNIEEIAVSRYL